MKPLNQNKMEEKLLVNEKHPSIIVPNLVIDLGDVQLTFKKSEITSKELLNAYMRLESFIEENFKHVYLKNH
jgi:hypothetical protein